MTKPSVIINGTNMDSQGWLRESISFPPPQSQSETATVPGRSSPIRFSLVSGRISWQPRTFKIVLTVLADHARFEEMTAQAANQFSGQLCKVTISERPDLYALGTLQMDSEYDASIHKGTLTIQCDDADSFFYHISPTVIEQTGNATVVLNCDYMPVVPEITTTADTGLVWHVLSDQFEKHLSAGTWTLPEFELRHGENSVEVTTTGTVTFTYREGCL